MAGLERQETININFVLYKTNATIGTTGIHVLVQLGLTESLLPSSLWAIYASSWDLEQDTAKGL